MKLIKKKQPKQEKENTFVPALGINDAIRKQFFTIYDIDRVNQIRQIKLNQNYI